MFNICHNGPSCLPLSDVTLLINAERTNVSTKRHNDELSKFSSKRNMYKIFHILLIYVISASTVDDYTVLACSIRFGIARFTGNV